MPRLRGEAALPECKWHRHAVPRRAGGARWPAPARLPAWDIARSKTMLDAILLAVGLGFFALSVAYIYGCERLW